MVEVLLVAVDALCQFQIHNVSAQYFHVLICTVSSLTSPVALPFALEFSPEFQVQPSQSLDMSTSSPKHQGGPFLSLKVVALKDLLAFLSSFVL